ncbi:MAG TPA: PAS domain S-box protein [Candidatus Binatia bacterium]
MNEPNPREHRVTAQENEFAADVGSLHVLYRLSTALLRPTDLRGALEQILQASMEIVGAPMGTVQLYDGDRDMLDLVAHQGFNQNALDHFRNVSLQDGSACGRAMAAGERVIVEDVERDSQFAPYRSVAASTGFRAVQSTPLVTRGAHRLGVVSTHFPQPHRPSERELHMLDLYLVHATDAIERVRAEEKLRENEERFRAVFEQAKVGVALCDPQEGRFLSVNQAYCDITGYSAEELLQKSWKDITHPDENIQAAVERERGGRDRNLPFHSLEKRYLKKDGSVAWVNLLGSHIRDQQGEVKYTAGVIIDITDRKVAEDALRQTSEYYRAIGDAIPYGVWIADAAGRNAYTSESFRALTGLTQAQCSGLGWIDAVHPSDAAMTRNTWQECVRTGTTWERDHRVKGIDSQWHPILSRGVPVKGEAGKIVAWVGINLDIGNRVRTRELARRQSQMLEETHDAIFQWEFDGGIVNWNRGAERLYGYSREEAMGQVPPVLLQTECPGGIEAVKEVLQRESVWNGELRHCTKDGREIFVESRMVLWRQPDTPLLIVEVNHDITDRKRAEMALRESEQKLRDQAKELEQQLIASGRLVSLGQVTASMAHEFNNPLGIIIGFVEDMLGNARPADPDYRALQIINDEATRCRKIVEDLMEYARPRSAEMSMIDLRGVIERALQLVETHLYKQKIEVMNETARMPKTYGDSQQLTQVLVNLYLNAIDAMPDGGTLRVGATAADDSTLIIFVADNGVGMGETEIEKIFQPFYTAKKRRGLGLGLPICERIIKNHGGEIKVRSRPGQGTTFEIQLPMRRREPDDGSRHDAANG